MRPPRALPELALAAATLTFLAVCLDGLRILPPLSDDEAWIASSAHKLASEGVYGSDLVAGRHGGERHTYHHMPLYPLLQAALFEVAGAGVLQMRLPSVICGLLVLWLVFAIGRQAGGDRVGLLAAALLMGQRLTGGGDRSGIPLLDLARVARYDIAVPVFGLAALWLFNRGPGSRGRWALIGGLIGLSGLCNVYGAFMLPALLVVLVRRDGARALVRRGPCCLLAGFALAWLPYLAFVASGWGDFAAQMDFSQPRFAVLSPRFYVDNLLQEVDRYRPMDMFDDVGRLRLDRPGAWAAILGLPIALWEMLRGRRSLEPAGALALVLCVEGLLFAALLQVKTFGYAIALWPVAVVALAWLAVRIWDSAGVPLVRAAVVCVLAVMLAEGAWAVACRREAATRATPYDAFERRLADRIPAGSRILGLPRYWLGLRDHGYRTWPIPSRPATLGEAVEHLRPDVVLIDRAMAEYFAGRSQPKDPEHEQYQTFQDYMAARGATLLETVSDPTYGPVRIYRVSGSGEEIR